MKNLILCLFACLLLAGCADHLSCAAAIARQPVGFWAGLWHGMVIPISWIGSLIDDDIAVYAIYNNGGWYDFGFVLGIGALGGGSGKAAS